LGRAWLPDHEVSFCYRSLSRDGGALTLEKRKGAAIPGALFAADERTWKILDLKESVEDGRYVRVTAHALDDAGEEHPCLTYQVTPEYRTADPIAPSPEYHGLVADGLRDLGLPTVQLDAAARGEAPPITPSDLFLYGTLMPDECRWHRVEPHLSGLVRAATTPGELLHLGRYPGLVHGSGGEAVTGELARLRLDDALIDTLDEIEGFSGYGIEGSLYRRVVREVRTATGTGFAWTYLYLGDERGARRIASGDWRAL
jgi:gamma-glutamylcyclotransferase (GGCT)/AIG2-like uncharacterized protein YtfP